MIINYTDVRNIVTREGGLNKQVLKTNGISPSNQVIWEILGFFFAAHSNKNTGVKYSYGIYLSKVLENTYDQRASYIFHSS